MKTCPQCRWETSGTGANFCGHCGTPLRPAARTPRPRDTVRSTREGLAVAEALEAAQRAASRVPRYEYDAFGFVWLDVYDPKIAKALKFVDTRKRRGKYSGMPPTNGRTLSQQEAYVRELARTLEKHGYEAFSRTNLD